MTRMRSVLASLSLLGLALLAVPAMGADSATAAVRARGKLRVLTYPPVGWIYKRPAGDYHGIDYDLCKAFAARLGVVLEVVEAPSFDQLIPLLLAGKGDMIASSFSITPARRKLVDYSTQYYPVLVMAVTREGSGLTTREQLRGKKACIVPGSSQDERLSQLAPGGRVEAKTSGDCLPLLARAQVDFTLLDSTLVVTDMATHYPTLKAIFDLPPPEYYGFALPPGSDLKQEADKFLDFARQSNYLYRVIEKQQGKRAAELFRLVESGQR